MFLLLCALRFASEVEVLGKDKRQKIKDKSLKQDKRQKFGTR